MQRTARKQLLAIGGIGGIAHDFLHGVCQIERRGVHRVVYAGVADIAIHVQAFCQTHGSRRGKAFSRSCRHKARGVERHGRCHGALALRDGLNTRRGLAFDMGHYRIGFRLSFETRRCMRGDEGVFVFVERAFDYPVIFRNERQALALTGNDKRQGGRLDAAGRTHVAVTGKLHQGKVARKHRTPDEVDVLTRSARTSQIGIERYQVAECVSYLFFGKCGITCTGNRCRVVNFLNA